MVAMAGRKQLRSQDEYCLFRIEEKLGDADGVCAKKALSYGYWIVTPAEPDHLRRRPKPRCHLKEIHVSADDGELVFLRVIPDNFICGLDKVWFADVNLSREELSQSHW